MQFSLFGAEAGDLVLADLDGVLLGGGHWVDTTDGARLSVVVADAWRVDALGDAFTALDVAGDDPARPAAAPGSAGAETDGYVARTRITPALRPLEARWRRGAAIAPPDDLVLSAAGLRLWAVTSGVTDEVGYVLRTPQVPDAAGPAGRLHRIAGALLARTGIAAVELGNRGGGPGWRVTSARRLRRLAELLGPPPPGAEAQWPTVTTGATGRPVERN
ncbi:hypothetical protein ACXR2U_03405 [Jatrophihabitans sp. YIM 134969]